MTRVAGLLFVVVLWLAACSHPSPVPPPSDAVTTASSRAAATASTSAPSVPGPPADNAPIDVVIAFIEAGKAADPTDYHTASYDGRVRLLDAPTDVAFRSPGDLQPREVAGCITTYNSDSVLHCLPGLRNPPSRPAELAGQWIGGWVDFDGDTITVGSPHGDPGPFMQGSGRELPYGERLAFGDYQCRSDPTGLYCVNYSHKSAVRLGDEVVPYGCHKESTSSLYVGEQYTCR